MAWYNPSDWIDEVNNWVGIASDYVTDAAQNVSGGGTTGGPPDAPPAPTSGVGTPQWMYEQFQNDPNMQMLFEQLATGAKKDYGALYKGAARSAADAQTRRITDALAARGGGALAPSLMLGGSLRTDAELEGLTASQAAQQNAQSSLLSGLGFKFNILNQIMGGQLGQVQSGIAAQTAQLQYQAARKQAEAQIESSKWDIVEAYAGK